MIELTAGKDDAGRRLDRIIRKALPDLSLSLIHRLFRQEKVSVNGQPASLNTRIEQGMVITIIADVNSSKNTVNKGLGPVIVNHEKLQVNNKTVNLKNQMVNKAEFCGGLPQILWQGLGVIVFNKPQGLAAHGPNSMDGIVKARLAAALPRSLSFKPGPLHRLDKPTSGIIIFSQTLEGARLFSGLLRERKLEKTYIAIVEGRVEKAELWRDFLARDDNARKTLVETAGAHSPKAKEALTEVKPLASNNRYSLVEARIKTGRHHQIRAQAASHGHPLAGDSKYGAKPFPGSSRAGGFFLHAWKITCGGPDIPDGFPRAITAPLPQPFLAHIEALFGAVTKTV
ncbi:MAG: RluA family pseudouridine synthase [Treponema sp.]|nr:RluA family pseudouridine synthase [Treponema sp.]